LLLLKRQNFGIVKCQEKWVEKEVIKSTDSIYTMLLEVVRMTAD